MTQIDEGGKNREKSNLSGGKNHLNQDTSGDGTDSEKGGDLKITQKFMQQ